MGHSDFQVVAVCDVNGTRLKEGKSIVDSHYGNKGYAVAISLEAFSTGMYCLSLTGTAD